MSNSLFGTPMAMTPGKIKFIKDTLDAPAYYGMPPVPPPPQTNAAADESSGALLRMIAMRLHLPSTVRLPFEHIDAYKRGDEVFLWVLTKEGEPVILKDDWPLFPSDKLITAIRVLKD